MDWTGEIREYTMCVSEMDAGTRQEHIGRRQKHSTYIVTGRNENIHDKNRRRHLKYHRI